MRLASTHLQTPCLVIDQAKLEHNINRMLSRCKALNVQFRPHLKTAKCLDIAKMLDHSPTQGVTVSTLLEAEYFLQNGFADVLYAVTIAPNKIEQALQLSAKYPEFKLLVDNMAVCKQLAETSEQQSIAVQVLIEIDVDGHRAGLLPEQIELAELAHYIEKAPSLMFRGLMTHAGESYTCRSLSEANKHAQQEVAEMMKAVKYLQSIGINSEIISVGSTPTAQAMTETADTTEIRAGVFVFNDLVMKNIGVCEIDDIALAVLSTIISHKTSHNRVIIDAGGLALSKDRGTADQQQDYGYGLVIDPDSGEPIDNLIVNQANQEHGVIQLAHSDQYAQLAIGKKLLILPNHACMTAAAYQQYEVFSQGKKVDCWSRINGW